MSRLATPQQNIPLPQEGMESLRMPANPGVMSIRDNLNLGGISPARLQQLQTSSFANPEILAALRQHSTPAAAIPAAIQPSSAPGLPQTAPSPTPSPASTPPMSSASGSSLSQLSMPESPASSGKFSLDTATSHASTSAAASPSLQMDGGNSHTLWNMKKQNPFQILFHKVVHMLKTVLGFGAGQ